MQRATYSVETPRVKFREYWLEWTSLAIALVIPLAVALHYRDAELFERAGSLTVFFAAVAEFITLNRLTHKHVLNACRAKNCETPWDVSAAAKYVGWASFATALLGTIIWGYGSKIAKVAVGT